MTRFYIVRHGESMGNSQNLFVGHTDVPLTPRGHAQAELTGEYLKDKTIDAFYSSDLSRALETCRHISDKKNMDIILCPELREIYGGDWEGKKYAGLAEADPGFEVWLNDMAKARCTGGESVAQVMHRVIAKMEDIAISNDGKTLCVACHATPIRIMCTIFGGYLLEQITSVPWVPNASVTEVIHDQGRWSIVIAGYKEHLGGISTELPSNV